MQNKLQCITVVCLKIDHLQESLRPGNAENKQGANNTSNTYTVAVWVFIPLNVFFDSFLI